MKNSYSFLSLMILSVMGLSAQSVIVPFGGDATDGSVTVSYTVGQVAVQANSDGSTTIYEGVQQPYEIQIIGIDNYPCITLNAVVFPNPTIGNVQLTINNVQLEGEVKVFDANGKFLFSREIEGGTTEIPMSDLSAGTYFVNVVSEKQVLKTFKVVKMAQ
ncbi:MAG: T9SS type A sorting domain-containing protein [Bacteroidales bacterium]|nr:T9SS type A sorting domain-containing protein [Bacteroidales bacterium]